MNVRQGTRRVLVASLLAAGIVGSLGVAPADASPPTILGWASNFDVADTTDRPCHGFEVEIEDINDVNVVYTYHNWRYGNASSIQNATFPSGHPGVRVKYAATYNAGTWSATTAIGAVEHFGISLNAPAGVQRYSWLCEDDLHPGTLIEYGGSTEGNHYPIPPPPSPRAVVVPTPQGEVVRQEIENAEPPEPGQDRPDAVWAQRFTASSDENVTLDDLMGGNVVVQETIANSMLDGQFELIDGGNSLADDDPVSAADEASIMVVDTYAYTGPYDDSHTPACDGLGGANDCTNFIGATRLARQMFSADLATATNARSPLNVSVYTGPTSGDSGGTVTSGTIPSADPEVGIDCGTSCFTVVDSGTAVTLTANPSPGFHLRSWSGACSGSAATCTVSVSAITPVTATFYPDDPTVYVADAAIVEGKAGTGKSMKFTVALTAAQPTTTMVNYSTADGTATAGSDYTAKSGSARIAAGRTTASISVRILGDDVVEGDETFGIDLNAITPGTIALGTATSGAVINDDDTAGAPSVTLGAATLFEGNGGTQNAAFTVRLSAPQAVATPVEYHTADATATAGSDYTAKAGTVNIAAGATSAKITVAVSGDAIAEGDETFRVLIDGTGGTGIATDHDVVLGTIVDDDGLAFAGVGVGDATTVEGSTGTAVVTVVVTMSSAQPTDTFVRYHSVDGSAAAGSDFTSKKGTIKILAGKTTGVITITVNGDTSVETLGESLSVLVDDAGAVPIHHGGATVSIVDDEG